METEGQNCRMGSYIYRPKKTKKVFERIRGASVIHILSHTLYFLSLYLSLYLFSDQVRVFPILERVDSAMISDSIPKASISMASSTPKNLPKKKRANRSAKVKQNKLVARRGQFISQVKNKIGCKDEANGEGGLHGGASVHPENERGQAMEKLEINPRGEEEIYGDGSPMNHYSDSESSPLNSPTSHTSSVLGSNGSGVQFTASSRSGSSSGRSSSSSSNGCCSEIMSEDDEEDDCLDDWEALADALAATEKKEEVHNPESEFDSPPEKHGIGSQSSGVVINPEIGGMAVKRDPELCRAWSPDDAFRPQSLPNLSKQYSFPLISERQLSRGGPVWGCKNVGGTVPTSCPICCEDLDCTDSSFLPCLCGFRLCLFCHKRILEQDARCPGCRKQYDRDDSIEKEATLDGGSLTIRLARSCSMITRS
ncbi:hypothetical protein ACJIZ3_004566 [Penstemon smallii]|uniref:RING-type domain-containing protein n=1 Tax=Penstemon smallii TaxID=265156 RepID=A0ABD3S2G0_9LAMI